MPGPISEQHKWNIAATIEVDERIARRAQRGAVTIPSSKIDVMETYCGQCRKTYEDVADQPCSAADSTEHLRGGPIGVRAKRNVPASAAAAVSLVQPVLRPSPRPPLRPAFRPVPTPVPVPAAAAVPVVTPRPKRRTVPRPVHPAAMMLPFELDATLTG